MSFKNICFYAIAISIALFMSLGLLEIGGYLRLEAALKKELPVNVMRTMIAWVDYFHHHRGAVWLNANPSPSDLVYEVVKKGGNGILLQGDSWIEALELDQSTGKPKKSGSSFFMITLMQDLGV